MNKLITIALLSIITGCAGIDSNPCQDRNIVCKFDRQSHNADKAEINMDGKPALRLSTVNVKPFAYVPARAPKAAPYGWWK